MKFDPKDHKLTVEDFAKLKYTNFHNHSTYSLLDGLGSVEEHIEETFKKGHQGCCITDHGVMNSSLELHDKARNKGLLKKIGYDGDKYPIVMGCELYITNDASYKDKNSKYHHVTVLAKNEAGYRNLSYLTSIGSLTDHFYTRPRISFHELIENKEGLIVTSGCFISYLSQAILHNKGHLKKYFFKLFNNDLNFTEDEENSFEKYKEEDDFEKYVEFLENDDFRKLMLKYEDTEILRINVFDEMMEFKTGSTETEKKVSERLIRDLFIKFSENTSEELVTIFKREFGDDFYIEFHPTNICMNWDRNLKKHIDQGFNPLEEVNRELFNISERHDIKIIICQDSHMPKKEHYDAQNIMIWNSVSGKKGWHFSEAYYIMSIEDMYKKITGIYPWISDENFIEWCNNSQEILDKAKDFDLNFNPSLPELDYESHYVNKVPKVIIRDIMIDLQEAGLWNEEVKDYMKEHNKLPLMKDFFKEEFAEAISKLSEKMTKFKTTLSDDHIKKENKIKKQIKANQVKLKANNKTYDLNLKKCEKLISQYKKMDNDLEKDVIKKLKKDEKSLMTKNNTLQKANDKISLKIQEDSEILNIISNEKDLVNFSYVISEEKYFDLLRIDEDINKVYELNVKDFIESFMPIDVIEENGKFVRFIKNIGTFSEKQNSYLKIYIKYEGKDCIDHEDMEYREKENVELEDILVNMESFYKGKEDDFYKIIYKSRDDLQLRTALKVIMRNKKIIPKVTLYDKVEKFVRDFLDKEIVKIEAQYERTKDEKLLVRIDKFKKGSYKDYSDEHIENLVNNNKFYEFSKDPMDLLGGKEARSRLAYEIETIQYNGVLKLITYFMLIEDVTNFHFDNNYLRGLGRGSGAGSLLAYGLHITDCEPLSNGLFFERFLTRERICEVFFSSKEEGFSFEDFLKEEGDNA